MNDDFKHSPPSVLVLATQITTPIARVDELELWFRRNAALLKTVDDDLKTFLENGGDHKHNAPVYERAMLRRIVAAPLLTQNVEEAERGLAGKLGTLVELINIVLLVNSPAGFAAVVRPSQLVDACTPHADEALKDFLKRFELTVHHAAPMRTRAALPAATLVEAAADGEGGAAFLRRRRQAIQQQHHVEVAPDTLRSLREARTALSTALAAERTAIDELDAITGSDEAAASARAVASGRREAHSDRVRQQRARIATLIREKPGLARASVADAASGLFTGEQTATLGVAADLGVDLDAILVTHAFFNNMLLARLLAVLRADAAGRAVLDAYEVAQAAQRAAEYTYDSLIRFCLTPNHRDVRLARASTTRSAREPRSQPEPVHRSLPAATTPSPARNATTLPPDVHRAAQRVISAMDPAMRQQRQQAQQCLLCGRPGHKWPTCRSWRAHVPAPAPTSATPPSAPAHSPPAPTSGGEPVHGPSPATSFSKNA